MYTYFDNDTYDKMGKPDLGDRIFIKRGGKRYFGKIHSVYYGTRKGIRLDIKVDKVAISEQ